MPINHTKLAEPSLSFKLAKIAPFLITLARFWLFWPMLLALRDKDYKQLIIWIIIFFILDKFDGVLSRFLNNDTSFGKMIDSFVDKTVFLIIFLTAFYYRIIPAWVFFIVSGINIIQIYLANFAIFFLMMKKLPVTYLPLISGGLLSLSLFLKESFAYLAYLLIIIIYLNHLYYYSKEVFQEKNVKIRNWFEEQKTHLERQSPINWVLAYWLLKFKRRSKLNVAAGIFTLSNIVTLFRIVLITPTIYYYWLGMIIIWLPLLFLFFGLDFIDGIFARKLNQISKIGKILDAAADKLMLFAFLIVWFIQGFLPNWLFSLILLRIILIFFIASLVFFLSKKPLPIAYFSFISVISLVLFIYYQNHIWLLFTILLTWQLIVNYYYQGIKIILCKSRY